MNTEELEKRPHMENIEPVVSSTSEQRSSGERGAAVGGALRGQEPATVSERWRDVPTVPTVSTVSYYSPAPPAGPALLLRVLLPTPVRTLPPLLIQWHAATVYPSLWGCAGRGISDFGTRGRC